MNGLFKRQGVFLISSAISILIIIWGYCNRDILNTAATMIMQMISYHYSWLYLVFIFFLCVFLVSIAVGKFGTIILGGENTRPDYSRFQWYAMLFCGGTGIGLVFWSIAEPLSHYAAPPGDITSFSEEAASFSIRTCFLHWGVTQWVCFAVVGLALAYSQYNKKRNGLISSMLIPLVGEKAAAGAFGKIVDIFAVIVSCAGVATSLGLGVSQICGGLDYLFSIPNESRTWFVIIVLITVLFAASAVSGINRGIKHLSSINSIIAFALLIAGFLAGPKVKIMNTMINGLGQHIQNFVGDILMIDPYGDNTWVMNWRVFYFAWFIAWTPFVGMFIARISKGRTIREFIFGVVIVPTIFTIIWLSVFGTIALDYAGTVDQDTVLNLIASPETAVFIVFEELPAGFLMSVLVIVLLLLFFITSADSATYSLSIMTSGGSMNPPVYKKLVWAVIEASMAYVLLTAGSLKALQTASIAASFPFLFIIAAVCISLVKELKRDVCCVR